MFRQTVLVFAQKKYKKKKRFVYSLLQAIFCVAWSCKNLLKSILNTTYKYFNTVLNELKYIQVSTKSKCKSEQMQ